MGRLDASYQDPSLNSQKVQRPGTGRPTAFWMAGTAGELYPDGGRDNPPPCEFTK